MGKNRYGRYGRPYRRFRKAVLSQGKPCCLCGRPIDPTLPWYDKWAGTLEHTIPVSKGGAVMDKRNAGPSHRHCNSVKGDRTYTPVLRTSRDW